MSYYRLAINPNQACDFVYKAIIDDLTNDSNITVKLIMTYYQ